MSRWRSRSLRVNLLLGLAGAALPIVAAELGLRLHRAYEKAGSSYTAVADPNLVYVRKPRADAEVNALGLRDRERSLEKPKDVFRIVVLGDSVTNGYRVAFADVYTRKLESLLNRGVRKYEVVNLGTNQYSTVQEVALFDRLGSQLSPDLVILAYVLNDPTPDGSINTLFRSDRRGSLVLAWLLDRYLAKWRGGGAAPRVENCRAFDYYSELHCDAAKWTAVRAAFARLAERSHHSGFPVLLVLFPLLDHRGRDSFEEYPWTAIHEMVRGEARHNGFAVLELLPSWARWRPSQLTISPPDDLHPNALGNQIAAEAIYETLVSLGVTSSPQAEPPASAENRSNDSPAAP